MMLVEVDYRALGKVIFQYRTRRHLTQEALAERIDMSAKFISNIERGVSKPSFNTILCLCLALEIEPQDLLTIDVARKSDDASPHVLRDCDSVFAYTLTDMFEDERRAAYEDLHPGKQSLTGTYDIEEKYVPHLA